MTPDEKRAVVADLLERPIDEIDDAGVDALHDRALAAAMRFVEGGMTYTASKIWAAARESYPGGLGQLGTDIDLDDEASADRPCTMCDGDRTHPLTDAMPCPACGGRG